MSALRTLAAIAGVGVLGAALSACATSTGTTASPACTPYAHGVVLVIGVHANEVAPDLTTGIVCRLTETIAAGMPVGAVAVDGAPRVLLAAETYPIAGDNAAARSNGIAHSVGSIVAAVQSAKPQHDGSDLLAGLILGARVAASGPAPITDMVVVDSGVTDTGLDLTVPGGTLVEAGEITQHEFAVHALDPDQFRGMHVAFWGLAETRTPQGELSLRQRDAVSALWPGIVRAAKGSAESVTFARSGSGVHTSHTVATAEVIEPEPFQPQAGDTLSFDGSTDLAFVADQSRLVDEKAARVLLAPIAAWLAADPSRRADVIGRTSSADPRRNAALSAARAQVCVQILHDAGAGSAQVDAVGAGYTADPPDTLPDGSLDPTAAALNRVVEIRLH
ncbi:MAG TPA: hypothetical protein VGM70_09150 [Pseudolysinimonas sp.]|jgi:outer membrane protein OmpA-like peptidoglycan-associated protein